MALIHQKTTQVIFFVQCSNKHREFGEEVDEETWIYVNKTPLLFICITNLSLDKLYTDQKYGYKLRILSGLIVKLRKQVHLKTKTNKLMRSTLTNCCLKNKFTPTQTELTNSYISRTDMGRVTTKGHYNTASGTSRKYREKVVDVKNG